MSAFNRAAASGLSENAVADAIRSLPESSRSSIPSWMNSAYEVMASNGPVTRPFSTALAMLARLVSLRQQPLVLMAAVASTARQSADQSV